MLPDSATDTALEGFEDWGDILRDDIMAAALNDRLVHHCHIVNIRGLTVRTAGERFRKLAELAI